MNTLQRLIPVDFNLQNPVNNEGVLFTLDQGRSGQELNLKIWNKSPGDLKFVGKTGRVSPTNFHLSLSFPPGLLLKPKSLKINAPEAFEAFWSYRYSKDDHGFDCYYFLWSGEEFILKNNDLLESIQFNLKKIFVDTKLAWRHTTAVLKTRDLFLGDDPMPESTRRIPLTVLHTFAVDLSDLETVRNFSGLKTQVTELRDNLIPPLKVRVLRGWNMLASGNERNIKIEVFLNPTFFSIHSQGALNAPYEQAQIRIFPIKDTPSADLSVETINNNSWDKLPRESEKEMIIYGPKSRGQKITRENPIQFNLTLNTGDLEMINLEIQCGGFEHGSNIIEDFKLHLPLNIGPMEMAEVEIPNSGIANDIDRDQSELTRMVMWGESANEHKYGILQIRSNAEPTAPNLRFGVLNTAESENDRLRSWIQSHGSKPLYINNVGNDVILNGKSGKVGIGNTHPQHKLDVSGTTRIKGKLTIEGDTEISGSIEAGEAKTGTWPRSSGYAFWGHKHLDHKTTVEKYALLQKSNGDTFLNSPSQLLFRIKNNTKMSISNDGQVKIGTLQTGTWPTSSSYSFWGDSRLDHKTTAEKYALLQRSNGDTFLNSPSQIMFRIRNADKMRLHSNGNLTIGTTRRYDDYRLFISGTCRATALRTSYVTLGSNSIKIGNTTIYENDLKILKKLVAGDLMVSIMNTRTNQHLYHNDWAKHDNDRMYALTWRKRTGKNIALSNGIWKIIPR